MDLLFIDPPKVDREIKPKIAPRVDRTKKPSATLPPRLPTGSASFGFGLDDEAGTTDHGMSSSNYYNYDENYYNQINDNYKKSIISYYNIEPPPYPTNHHNINGYSRKTSDYSNTRLTPSPKHSQSSLPEGLYENSTLDGDDDDTVFEERPPYETFGPCTVCIHFDHCFM